MDPVEVAINNLFVRFMLLQSYDASDEQIKFLFEKILQLPCDEHGPDCISNMTFTKLTEDTKSSLKDKFKQLSEGFKTSDTPGKLAMIENIWNEINPIIDYKFESKCITHIVAHKVLFRCKTMVGGNNPENTTSTDSTDGTLSGFNILSLFSVLSNTPNLPEHTTTQSTVNATSLVRRSRFRPVYYE